jgi:hypothetical protein
MIDPSVFVVLAGVAATVAAGRWRDGALLVSLTPDVSRPHRTCTSDPTVWEQCDGVRP